MKAKVRLSKNELIELIATTEAEGNDTTKLRELLAEVEQGKRLEKPVNQVTDEEHVAAVRSKSYKEYGIDLECMVCADEYGITELESAFFHRDGSGVEERLANHLGVVGLE
ncbi:hypothetical protein ES703_29514 [subsurface metagenome]